MGPPTDTRLYHKHLLGLQVRRTSDCHNSDGSWKRQAVQLEQLDEPRRAHSKWRIIRATRRNIHGSKLNHTVTANYVTQWQETFQQSGLSNDASGTVLTVGSNTYTYGQLPQTGIWVDDGTTYSYASTLAGSGKTYVLTGVTGGLASPIHSSGTATGNYNAPVPGVVCCKPLWKRHDFSVRNQCLGDPRVSLNICKL